MLVLVPLKIVCDDPVAVVVVVDVGVVGGGGVGHEAGPIRVPCQRRRREGQALFQLGSRIAHPPR